MRRFTMGIAGLMVAAVLAIGCSAKDAHHRQMAKDTLPRVEVLRPTVIESFPRRIELTVTVEPMAKVDLCARVPGIVKTLPETIDIGRRVKEGETLLVLDVPDLIAQRDHKRANLDLAKQQKAQVIEARKVLAQEVEESKHLVASSRPSTTPGPTNTRGLECWSNATPRRRKLRKRSCVSGRRPKPRGKPPRHKP